jgi:hypothetical protein
MSASCPSSTPLDVGQCRGVAAQQAMVAQDPEVARLADRVLWRLRNLVLSLIARRLAVGQRQQALQLRGVEANQVEVEALVAQPSQLFRQQRIIPARLQRELVVGDQIRPLLGLAQLVEPNHRHLGEPELARGEQPAVTGEDAALLVNQHRVRPPEFHHARRDLIDLRLAVRARIALVRAQPVDWPKLYPVGERHQPGALRCVGQVRTSSCELGCEPGATAVAGVAAQNLRNSAAFDRIQCDGWCEPRCDGRFAPIAAPNPRDSAAYGGFSANLSATGATGKFAPRRARNPSKPAAFGLPVRRVGANCEPGIAGCR